IGPTPEPLSPNWYEAYDLYLKGRYYWNKRTQQGFEQAIENFQQALDKDPDFARAYAGLADSYALMSSWGLGRATELMPKARTAALRALELDERLAEAHTSLALIYEKYDWNWKAAEKEFRRAIELDPNYATAHHWYAEYLGYQARFDEALAESERARRLDPLSLIIAVDRGEILIFAHQYDRAIEQLQAVIGVDPDFPRSDMLIAAYREKRAFAEALAEVERRKRRGGPPYPTWILGNEILTLGRMGRLEQARKALHELKEANRASEVKVDPTCLAAGAGLIGKDTLFACFEKAYQEHNGLSDLKVNPSYDSFRSDPRFQDLMRIVGLTR